MKISRFVFSLLFSAVPCCLATVANTESPQPESTIGFLKNGKPLAEQVSVLSAKERRKYEKAIARFAESPCTDLVSESARARVDWARIRNTTDLEVCLFQSAAALKNIESLISLLEERDFRNVSSNLYNQKVTSRIGIEGDGYLVDASMSVDSLPDHFGGWFGIRTWGVYGLSVGMFVDSNGKPFDVKATLNRN